METTYPVSSAVKAREYILTSSVVLSQGGGCWLVYHVTQFCGCGLSYNVRAKTVATLDIDRSTALQ
jgi:hypothetical protein